MTSTATPIQKLSIVVPCFNEALNLRRFPAELFKPAAQLFPSLEVVLVDDGSTDDTYNVMRDLQRQYPFVKVCQHMENRGLGGGIRTGIDHSSGDAILTMDGDLTFGAQDLPVMLNAYDASVDCVMGSPFEGKMEGVHLFRAFLSWSVNSIYRKMLGRPVSSVSSIFRLYRAHRLKSLHLTCESFDINAEILFKMIQSGGRVVEVPVTLGKRKHGVSKINVPREIKNHLKMFFRIHQWKKANLK